MFKKFLIALLLVHTLSVGVNVASATELLDSSLTAENELNEMESFPTMQTSSGEEETGTNLITQNEAEQSSNVGVEEPGLNQDTDGIEEATESSSGPESEEPEVDLSQDQSSNQDVTQNQNVTPETEVGQDQVAVVTVCQEQLLDASAAACGEKEQTPGQLDQSQTVELESSQNQLIDTVIPTEVNQEQTTEIVSDQSQGVIVSTGEEASQNQNTNIETNQSQTANVKDGFVSQGQSNDITNDQAQELAAKKDHQTQSTTINAEQLQVVNTSDSTTIEQTQSAEVSGGITDTYNEKVDASIKVYTKNFVDIIKNTTNRVVRFFQEIIVNDEIVDTLDESYTLEDNDTQIRFTNYEKHYDWGNLVIHNNAEVIYSESLQNSTTSMSSLLSVIFQLANDVERDSDFPREDWEWKPDPNCGGCGDEDEEPPVEEPPVEEPPVEEPPVEEPPVEEPPVEEPPVEEPPAEQPEAPSDVGDSQESMQPEGAGNELPNTSTSMYNYLLAGLLLIFMGTIFFFNPKRV